MKHLLLFGHIISGIQIADASRQRGEEHRDKYTHRADQGSIIGIQTHAGQADHGGNDDVVRGI